MSYVQVVHWEIYGNTGSGERVLPDDALGIITHWDWRPIGGGLYNYTVEIRPGVPLAFYKFTAFAGPGAPVKMEVDGFPPISQNLAPGEEATIISTVGLGIATISTPVTSPTIEDIIAGRIATSGIKNHNAFPDLGSSKLGNALSIPPGLPAGALQVLSKYR